VGQAERPTCPACGAYLTLALPPGGKGKRTFRCLDCDGPDPLKTDEATGWLKSELASMSSADEYYAYVGECIALASRCLHPADKARLLQMAKAWRDLAEKLEASQNKLAAKDSA
jgi:hypothetical protein